MKSLANYWRSLTPLTQNIVKFVLINLVILLVNLLVSLVFLKSGKGTGVFQIVKFLAFKQKHDSWKPMIFAFDYIQSQHQIPIYTKVFFEEHVKFQYPLTSLLVIDFLNIIDNVFKGVNITWFDRLNWLRILNYISWAISIVMATFTVKIFNLSLKSNINDTNLAKPTKFDTKIRAISIFCLFLMFYPVLKAYTLGQIQVWINALSAIVLWCWMKEKKVASGILSGLLCLLKPQYVVFFLWGISRRQWKFTLAFAIVSTSITLLSISLFGITDNINYFSVLSFISRHGEAFHANQSLNGLLNRLLFNGDNLNFTNSFPPFNIVVYTITALTSIILVGMALLPVKKAEGKAGIIDFSIIAITCTMASPVAWEHHYGICLPIYAFLLPLILSNPKTLTMRMIFYLCMSYILVSHRFPVFDKLAPIPVLNIMQSDTFIGGLILLFGLYYLRRKTQISTKSIDEKVEMIEISY